MTPTWNKQQTPGFSKTWGLLIIFSTGNRTASARPDPVLISVEDTGEGIPPSDLPHIFDRFYRADADGASSGLGLAIAKALVEAHGGRIGAESEEGGGTSMRVELPTQ